MFNKSCRRLDSNPGPLVSEVTALPTTPQPLPWNFFIGYLSIFASLISFFWAFVSPNLGIWGSFSLSLSDIISSIFTSFLSFYFSFCSLSLSLFLSFQIWINWVHSLSLWAFVSPNLGILGSFSLIYFLPFSPLLSLTLFLIMFPLSLSHFRLVKLGLFYL